MPDFTDPRLFPSFYQLPSIAEASALSALSSTNTSISTSSSGSSTNKAENDKQNDGGAGALEPWFLLAQVKENMTITQPTLIVTDHTGVDFALIFEDRDKSLKSFKKTYTVVVPCAVRTDREGEGKKAIVRVEKGMGRVSRSYQAALRGFSSWASSLTVAPSASAAARAVPPRVWCCRDASAAGLLCTAARNVRR
ncbi:hypothetical protein MN608_07766 [Microdochium nivale]|nr:hypothetical protein MN608_07766 [Microdochium nivale]